MIDLQVHAEPSDARDDYWAFPATALSASATTRLVNRLEERGLLTRILCIDDRRGIYTELTASGQALLAEARPIHDDTLESALAEARGVPELAPLVDALPTLAVA